MLSTLLIINPDLPEEIFQLKVKAEINQQHKTGINNAMYNNATPKVVAGFNNQQTKQHACKQSDDHATDTLVNMDQRKTYCKIQESQVCTTGKHSEPFGGNP